MARFESPESYESQCMDGLRLSGEGIAYFARGRLAELHAWWCAQGRAAPAKIVDYGCGTGVATALVHEFFPQAEVVGVDPSPAYVEQARSDHGGERLSFIGVDEFATHAGVADLIHINGVLHHVPPEERAAFFSETSAALAPGGVFALFENNPLNPGTQLVMNRIPFDRDAVRVPAWEARRRLRDAGLRVAATRYLFFFPRPLRALRGLERHLLRVPLGAQYGVFAVRENVGLRN